MLIFNISHSKQVNLVRFVIRVVCSCPKSGVFDSDLVCYPSYSDLFVSEIPC
ncbi:unnamed protein product [Rhodiola kirilowii]